MKATITILTLFLFFFFFFGLAMFGFYMDHDSFVALSGQDFFNAFLVGLLLLLNFQFIKVAITI